MVNNRTADKWISNIKSKWLNAKSFWTVSNMVVENNKSYWTVNNMVVENNKSYWMVNNMAVENNKKYQ